MRARTAPGAAARLAALALGAAAARAAYAAATRSGGLQAEAWSRSNHRGERVTLLEGPALAAGAATAAAFTPGIPGRLRAAAVVACLGGGVVGIYDDFGGHPHIRGFRGHLGALRRGRVTSGAVKIAGMGAAGLAAASLATDGPRHPAAHRGDGPTTILDALLGAGVVAGTANFLNLLDLRPGRAIKVGLVAGAPLLLGRGGTAGGAAVAAAPMGAAAALLPEDLAERAMLGDGGAHAFGALLGLAAATGLSRRGRAALLASLAGLAVTSEAVSFSKIIDAVAPLRWLDGLGRRPSPPRRRRM